MKPTLFLRLLIEVKGFPCFSVISALEKNLFMKAIAQQHGILAMNINTDLVIFKLLAHWQLVTLRC